MSYVICMPFLKEGGITGGGCDRAIVAITSTTKSSLSAIVSTTMTRSRGITTHSQLSSEHSMVYEMCRNLPMRN